MGVFDELCRNNCQPEADGFLILTVNDRQILPYKQKSQNESHVPRFLTDTNDPP